MKERLIVSQLRDFIENEKTCPIAVMAGIRRIGKTTALKQLLEQYPGSTYLNFREDMTASNLLEEFFQKPGRLLLLDEITYLDGYEKICGDIYIAAGGQATWKFKVVITGSSPAHLFKLALTTLGGGRCRIFNLPIISFVEYLYFTDKIPSYADYEMVTSDDFRSYLKLDGLQADLALSFDEQYFLDYYEINDDSNDNSHVGKSMTELSRNDLLNVAHLLAYQLAEHATYKTTMNPDIGGQELKHLLNTKERRNLSFSDTLIFKSVEGVKQIAPENRARVIKFLLDSRIANIGTTLYSKDEEKQEASALYRELKSVTNDAYLSKLFADISVTICSPLLYTRLGNNILQSVGIDLEWVLSDNIYNDLLGKMLEVYIRGALAAYGNAILPFTSAKLNYPLVGEVDIFDDDYSILCEVSVGKKDLSKINVAKYYKDIPYIRICTTQNHEDQINGFYRIPYAKLCCMIDTGDILKLEKTVIDDKTAKPKTMDCFGE